MIYDVYKHSKRLRGEEGALDAVAAMRKTQVVPLNEELALIAADISLETKLAMAAALKSQVSSGVSFNSVLSALLAPSVRQTRVWRGARKEP